MLSRVRFICSFQLDSPKMDYTPICKVIFVIMVVILARGAVLGQTLQAL